MKNWKTELRLKHVNGEIGLPGIRIKRGIFQGNNLSPLLFVLALDPLSRLLNGMETAYKIYKKQ